MFLFDVFNGCSSSIKEVNSLINNGMWVLLFSISNRCFWVQLFNKRLFWNYCHQLSFVYYAVSQISSGDKRLLSELFRKWDWNFKKWKFQKTETQLCRRKSNEYNNIIIFLLLENACTSLLWKEKTWKLILTLTVNYRKTVQKNKLWHSKHY